MKLWPPRRARLNLALQGGGAHGAFTWGVLDALLERDAVQVAAVSAASAGAMNAAVLAHGLASGGAPGARRALDAFWSAVGTRIPFEWLTIGEGDGLALSPAARVLMHWLQWLAPVQFNPLGFDPLRDILREQIDFERLRRHSPVELHIAATHANSGRLRLFRNGELSTEVLLASACLPTLHHTVTIEGEPYWDGGYSANPALAPLVWSDAAADDTLLVLLLPLQHDVEPRTAAEIRERLLDIAFTAPLLRELDLLARLQRRSRARWSLPGSLERRAARARWHLIDAQASLAALGGDTRLIAHLPFLQRLRDAGRAQALQWLQTKGAQVGHRSTVAFGDLLRPAPPGAA